MVLPSRPLTLRREVVRVAGGKRQGSPIDRQHQGSAPCTENFLWIHRVQRRQLCRFDRRQRNDQHRHGTMKGRSRVERQRQLVASRGGQGRDVLILRRAKRFHDPRNVEYRGDVRTVVAVTQLRRITCLHCQIAARTRGQCFDNRGAVAVVQNQRLLALHQTRRLQLGDSVQAFVFDFNGEAACQQGCRVF